jgi:hypothetical protein
MAFASIGLKLIYQTLTNKYKGLLIFLLGATLLTFTILFTTFMITSMAGFRADLLSVILLSETLFFILAAFIPGLYNFSKKLN